MMKLYPENYDVEVEVAFSDLNNAPIVVTEIRAALYDGDDQVIVDFGSLPFDSADTSKSITVPASFNVLGEGELSAARILRVTLQTAAGAIRRSHGYIIEGESRLELLNNTFVTLEASEALARDMPELKAWRSASDEQRAAALINAFTRLKRIQLRVTYPSRINATHSETLDRDGYECMMETILWPGIWDELTVDDFLDLPRDFRRALRMAQISEANEILTDDPIQSRHRAGVISETVGESSMMLRGGKLQIGVAEQTLRYLSGYVYYKVGVARA